MHETDQKLRPRSMRHKYWNYADYGWYFVTICTKDRVCRFCNIDPQGIIELSPIGKIVSEEWQNTPNIRSYVELDEWIVMPNHLHGIITINRDSKTEHYKRLPSGSLGAVIGRFKSTCTKCIRDAGYNDFFWQRGYYDHIIRNEKDLDRIRLYIHNNPLKWALDDDNPRNW